jgi:hypothetical protein
MSITSWVLKLKSIKIKCSWCWEGSINSSALNLAGWHALLMLVIKKHGIGGDEKKCCCDRGNVKTFGRNESAAKFLEA